MEEDEEKRIEIYFKLYNEDEIINNPSKSILNTIIILLKQVCDFLESYEFSEGYFNFTIYKIINSLKMLLIRGKK